MSGELSNSPGLEDALRRIAQAIEPIAASAETGRVAPPPAETGQVAPKRRRIRRSIAVASLLVVVAAASAAGALVALVPNSDRPLRATVGVGQLPDSEISELRSALARSMEEQVRLAAELERARGSKRWFDDPNVLNYRNPWSPR